MSTKYENEMREYQRTLAALFPEGAGKGPTSFSKWRQNAQIVRDMLMKRLDEDNVKRRQIDAEFTTNYASARKAKIDADYAEMCEAGARVIRKGFDAVLAAKRESFKNAMKAPTDEQLRLLTALSMRQNVGGDEISYFAENLAGNLPALRCLSEVAGKNKIAFPAILTGSELEDSLESSSAAMEKYLSTLGVGTDDLKYEHRLFWCTSGGFRESNTFDTLDSPGFMSAGIGMNGDNKNATS